ncbi:MAG TPA: branched-chain amino acid ABC transporter permease [Symbiobacteriaceae bacterium]|nr:branched-chain amino acid ABC transporter permease [Symbiobacteriaceae bacterium]
MNLFAVRGWSRYAGLALAGAAIAVLFTGPAYLGRGTLNDIWNVAFYVILGSAWNLMGGLAGQVSFGYSAFMGIGAYATVLLALAGWNAYATIPVGMAVAALFSVIVGLPTFRLRGPYFTIATIGISEAVRVVAQGFEWTGGSSGKRMPLNYGDFLYKLLPGVPRGQAIFLENYYGMLILTVLVVAVVWWVMSSRFGMALASIKQDIDAAEALGVNATGYKVRAHALSAALVAAAGSLFAINFQYIAPNSVFAFNMSLQIVLMPVIGGVGTLLGPVIGGVVFGYIQIKLLTIQALRDSNLMIYGTLLIVVMLFEPAGILGLLRRLGRLVSRITSPAAKAAQPASKGVPNGA